MGEEEEKEEEEYKPLNPVRFSAQLEMRSS